MKKEDLIHNHSNTMFILSYIYQCISFIVDKKFILNVYHYGSWTYGTNHENSDFDYLLVVNDLYNEIDDFEYKNDLINIHIVTSKHFKEGIKNHNIKYLECLFLDSKFVLKEDLVIDFILDKIKLRKSISHFANNSWAKAGKKIKFDFEDTFTGYKSLYHSFRILNFGIQIATFSAIKDFKVYSILWNELLFLYNKNASWDNLQVIFKKKHNLLFSSFRKLAPKK